MERDKTPLATMTPDWLNLAIEHRTRYDVYDHGFTRTIPGFNDQINQRTRFFYTAPSRLNIEGFFENSYATKFEVGRLYGCWMSAWDGIRNGVT